MRSKKWWVKAGRRWLSALCLGVLLGIVLTTGSWAIGNIDQGARANGNHLQALITGKVGLAPASGGLRVYNQSAHQLRLVLMSRQRKTSIANPNHTYDDPAHWDFIPWEGQLQGMRIVLAERMLQLQAGDVVVAFAEDGSTEYWGPFVVGETALPLWDKAAQEWRLHLTDTSPKP
jgi:hypothetical protein